MPRLAERLTIGLLQIGHDGTVPSFSLTAGVEIVPKIRLDGVLIVAARIALGFDAAENGTLPVTGMAWRSLNDAMC